MDPANLDSLIADYLAAWGQPDPAQRHALLESAWEAAATYIDPRLHAAGRAELHELIGRFLARSPGATFNTSGTIDHHHHYVRFFWTLHYADGSELPGMDFGEISPDGKLSRIVGFY